MAKKPRPAAPNPDARTIVWASNNPDLPTGYGTQTAQVVKRLHRDGHRVSVAGNYGSEGHVTTWNGVRIWPRGFGPYSEDVLPAYTQAWAAEHRDLDPLVITLFDVWVYNDFPDKVPHVASWVPVDHLPCPPKVLNFLKRPNVTPIAMSKFGRDMIEAAGIESLYVPHALESCWRPTPTYKGVTGRELMGVPDDAYLITLNNANKGASPSRKSWPENLTAAARVMRRHDDVWLYLHTEDKGSMQGLNMHHLLEAVGAPMERVKIVEQFSYRMGLPQEYVAAVYTASDLLLACSMGEGFGLTVLEAQTTGTPVVVSDFTAQPELVGDGWKVTGQPFWDAAQGAWWLMPNVDEIEDALEQAYARGRYRSQEAIEFTKGYDADLVYEDYWKPALKVLKP